MKALLTGSERIYFSAFALASKCETRVYLPCERSVTDGRVLKMMDATRYSTGVSAIVLAALRSISRPLGSKEGVVMAKTV